MNDSGIYCKESNLSNVVRRRRIQSFLFVTAAAAVTSHKDYGFIQFLPRPDTGTLPAVYSSRYSRGAKNKNQ